ncbi:hypothetical protein DXA95_12300 [Odoribacter sp. OF09-27XD]|jgi:hypothetical protein|nr:hypothetical protein [Odoribacter sp. OF09-27XD]RHV92579.1 hypothetical protein DXA95_12300 [Odoribacter sp. OF09-27XD]DAV89679.1 MAG TPA: zinc-ribbon domain protein [Bacteriophage sp.]
MEQEDKLYCPHCGSSQLTANKKGYGVGKAAAGVLLTGGVGLLAGFIGSGKVKITCLKCGKVMKPGELRTTPLPPSPKVPVQELNGGCMLAAVIGGPLIFLILFMYMCS